MVNGQKKRRLLAMPVGLCLLLVSAAYPQKATEEPTTRGALLKALETKLTDSGARYLIKRIQTRGVAFELSDSDKEIIRVRQRHLGTKRLDDLIKAIKDNYRDPAVTATGDLRVTWIGISVGRVEGEPEAGTVTLILMRISS
jgi:hypothetical protein